MAGKLVNCKSCGKEVSNTAKTCPHCGEGHPGMKLGKGCGMGCLVIFIISLAFGIYVGFFTDDPAINDAQTKQSSEFTFTVEEIIDRYNQSMKTINQQIQVSLKEENRNEKYLTIQLKSSSKAIAIVLTANTETRLVNSIVLIGGGDGTAKSGLDIIFGITALVMAVEDPAMSLDGRKGIGQDFGITDSTLMDYKKRTIDRGDFRYTQTISDTFGIMITATPI